MVKIASWQNRTGRNFRHASISANSVSFATDVKSFTDYYAFGWAMPGRNYSAGEYRYGIQGQEMDDELWGTDVAATYKYRVAHSQLGRFFAVDPLADKYPYNSQYAFSENRVVDGVELEGLEYLSIAEAKKYGFSVGPQENGERSLSFG